MIDVAHLSVLRVRRLVLDGAVRRLRLLAEPAPRSYVYEVQFVGGERRTAALEGEDVALVERVCKRGGVSFERPRAEFRAAECDGKEAFGTRAAAARATRRKGLVAYKCSFCGLLHLGDDAINRGAAARRARK